MLTYVHPQTAPLTVDSFMGQHWHVEQLICAAANHAEPVTGHGFVRRPRLHAINGRPC